MATRKPTHPLSPEINLAPCKTALVFYLNTNRPRATRSERNGKLLTCWRATCLLSAILRLLWARSGIHVFKRLTRQLSMNHAALLQRILKDRTLGFYLLLQLHFIHATSRHTRNANCIVVQSPLPPQCHRHTICRLGEVGNSQPSALPFSEAGLPRSLEPRLPSERQ